MCVVLVVRVVRSGATANISRCRPSRCVACPLRRLLVCWLPLFRSLILSVSISQIDIRDDFAVIASLGQLGGMDDGSVGVVDQRTGKIVSVLEVSPFSSTPLMLALTLASAPLCHTRCFATPQVAALLGHAGPSSGHKHPHDAIFLANGDIAVCTWNPGKISYWRKLESSKM